MIDDQLFTEVTKAPLFVLAEVKLRDASINPSWERVKNAQRFLKFVGFYPSSSICAIAEALCENDRYQDRSYDIRYVMVGDSITTCTKRRWPSALYIDWEKIGGFIHHRFINRLSVKSDHDQWDKAGKCLYSLVSTNRDPNCFLVELRKCIGL